MTLPVDTQFDPQFEQVSKLTWYPWVGNSYAQLSNQRRLLIVGESHYYDSPDGLKEFSESNGATRLILNHYGREIPRDGDLFGRIYRTLIADKHIDRPTFWSKVAFYNFVQRPMNSNFKEKPSAEDFKAGWSVFAEVLPILNPGHVLFIGTTAANTIGEIRKAPVELHHKTHHEKINGALFKTAQLTPHGGVPLDISFIKHTQMAFTVEDWQPKVQERIGGLLAGL